jgi:hypothetical protein
MNVNILHILSLFITKFIRIIRLAYQSPASSSFISHNKSNTSRRCFSLGTNQHQPPTKVTGWYVRVRSIFIPSTIQMTHTNTVASCRFCGISHFSFSSVAHSRSIWLRYLQDESEASKKASILRHLNSRSFCFALPPKKESTTSWSKTRPQNRNSFLYA